MVQVWKKGDGEEEVCKNCNSRYAVTISRFPMRDNDYFNCEVCGHRMKTWNDTAVPSYRLIQKGEKPDA